MAWADVCGQRGEAERLLPRILAGYGRLKYRAAVKFKPHAIVCRGCLAAVLLAILAGSAEAKPIRLRNETIEPAAPASAPSAAPADAIPVRGLFLIQFAAPPHPEWRAQLQALGVDLLHYVPDDAFIAKLDGVPMGQIRALRFVNWLGAYRPEHKVQARLTAASTNATAVAAWLSPGATQAELAQARQCFVDSIPATDFRPDRIVRGQLKPGQLDALARADAVLWIEPAPRMRLFDEVASRIVGGDGPQGQTQVQALGYTGAGVTVSVADSGLDSGDTNSMHPDIAGRVGALLYYGSLEDAADEHSHGTHCAGIIAGNGATGETDENGFLYGLGVAPGARLVAQRLFDANGGYVVPADFQFETLTRDAKQAGADIGSNSWGDDTQGRYDTSARDFDRLVRDADELTFGDQPYILEFSAGNAGPNYRTIGSPAVGKNVIATGASQNDRFNLPMEEFAIYAEGRDSMADFSSRGPCEDGRIKPDLVAPGSWIASLRSVYANDGYAWWPISDNYLYQGGTSQAGPHVAGAAAVFVHYYRAMHGGATPSPALVKAALINSATDMDDGYSTDAVPNDDEGWGRVDLPALIASGRDNDFTDQTTLLTTGAVFEKRVLIGSAGGPLKITLTYTDVPGNPAAVLALVNDLDLEVLAPTGERYRGNRFADGESIPDAAGTDTVNNVEAVHLASPVPGEYVIRVRGSRVVQDARRDTPAVDQDFALVVSGRFAATGVGIVTFDRRVYRAPDQIRLALVDYDLAGQGSASVTLRSATEPAGETLTLSASGSNGVFTGSVATATGPAITDGKLQVAHGNWIEARYADASPASNRVFTAIADLQSPVISNVSGTNRFAQVVVSWDTQEPAGGELYYGTPSPNLALTNRVQDLAQEFLLLNVPANAPLQFFVVAQDEAGNRATNDNGGSFFTVTNLQPSTVLLVDSYVNSTGYIEPPDLSGYTDALNSIGVAYDVFSAGTGDGPSLAQLQAYRCVIWRMDEVSAPNLTLAQKIASYVNSGGSIFIASMEVVTGMAKAGFASFNTNILQCPYTIVDQPVDSIIAAPGDPVGAGMDTALDYAPYDELLALLAWLGVSDPSDWIVPTTNAAPVLFSDGHLVGIRSPKPGVDLPGRVVFFSFPLDAVPMGDGLGNNRAGLLRNALNFLAPPANVSTIALDSDVYSVPGRAVIEVEDAGQKGAGSLAVTAQRVGHTNEAVLTLLETTRRGLFRGGLIFVPTNTGAPGTLFVADSDSVQFDYHDAVKGVTVSATATIETNAPVISNVEIEPGYLEALVSWTTSEPADGLVQYSESPDAFPYNYTAYDSLRVTDHQMFLSNLKPNTTYYLRVTSRDRAGNATVDDNDGEFHIFTTLQPLTPPWFDDMEAASLDWTVISPAESESEWTRGVPGHGETGHESINCWGSNLGGGPVGLMESYLISPGVLLTGGNRATLRFFHNYDFTPQSDYELQLAGLYIITNIATEPVLLRQMPEDLSDGWEEFTCDLTPFLGQVVYIAWYHFLFSMDDAPRLGWLVDDVSIEVTNLTLGTIQVTNNLWQAVFALSGPVNRLGSGRWTAVSNASPGQYVVQFGSVPHFVTPPPQTNTLAAGGIVTFQGNYTFTDANTNGIPDAYEQEKFGAVSPLRTRATDTDSDGLSDYAEFVAGTDPNNPPPPFALTAQRLPGGLVQLAWPSVTNHSYRVLAGANLTTWLPFSGWLATTSLVTTFTIPAPTNGAPNLFRVEAAPPGGPEALSAVFRATVSHGTNGALQLDWPTAPGHGYRVLGSTNAIVWTPFSEWLRATNFAAAFTTNLPGSNSPLLFRIEAAP